MKLVEISPRIKIVSWNILCLLYGNLTFSKLGYFICNMKDFSMHASHGNLTFNFQPAKSSLVLPEQNSAIATTFRGS